MERRMLLLWSCIVLAEILSCFAHPLFGDSNQDDDSLFPKRRRTPKGPKGTPRVVDRKKELERIKELLKESQKQTPEPGFHSQAPNGSNPTEDNIICGTDKLPEEESRNFTAYPVKMWKNGIPYILNPQGYSEENLTFIKDNIQKWNEEFPMVQFREKKDEDEDYIEIENGYGCSSNIGKLGGKQTLNLQYSKSDYTLISCLSERTVFHEFLHAVGFIHEHNRVDRDDYIKVADYFLYSRGEVANNFKKVEMMEYNLLGKYDYYSIMHYARSARGYYYNAFEVLQDGIDVDKIGHVDVSDTDREKVKALYKYFNKK